MPRVEPASFDVFDVLLRAGAERTEFLAAVGTETAVDAGLVSDVLRTHGRVAATHSRHRELAELCAVLRALDAHRRELIGLAELRSGIAAHAARTDGFARFHDARVLLRTLDEVLDLHERAPQQALGAQVSYLHDELEAWLRVELLGAAPNEAPELAARSEDEHRIGDSRERARAEAVAAELLDGAAHHPVAGLAGAAWLRGWAAVPVPGDLVSDDPAEAARLRAALGADPARRCVLVLRTAPERWHLGGTRVRAGDGLRPSYAAATTDDAALVRLLGISRAAAILTDLDATFAVLEDVDHHVIAGPRAFVEAVLGTSVPEALAVFRDHVERMEVDGEVPEHLLEASRRYGRLRRRPATP
jgi:hypothetical protein